MNGNDVALRVRGADDGDILTVRDEHLEQCRWWQQRWDQFDQTTCNVNCFGGCIPCWRPRMDPSVFGEPVGSC